MLSGRRRGAEGNTRLCLFEVVGFEILELPLPPRLGHPYQSERGVSIQCPGNREVSKHPPTQSGNPSRRHAFPPRGVPHEPNTRSVFGYEGQGFIIYQSSGPLDPF
jgi:hypothetical protein